MEYLFSVLLRQDLDCSNFVSFEEEVIAGAMNSNKIFQASNHDTGVNKLILFGENILIGKPLPLIKLDHAGCLADPTSQTICSVYILDYH